ncbi:hypothetical protein ABE28_016235 [Peribacillus muralis]|uniref:Uncharacterized protein n=1 Tax=Peribacillus muralis TaxID=264697 RepID=A0A1B3XRU0_9BACI|nr:hypothetical protein ABE28_016235 [Peribacillus muralis]
MSKKEAANSIKILKINGFVMEVIYFEWSIKCSLRFIADWNATVKPKLRTVGILLLLMKSGMKEWSNNTQKKL